MWKDIDGFDGHYSVNERGDIRSNEREICDKCGHVYIIKERILKQNTLPNGYKCVHLCINGESYPKYVHRLVAEAFIPREDETLVINHIDGNKANNSVNNLEWVTYSENNQHAYDTGLHKRGEKHYKAKLTLENVCFIRNNIEGRTFEYFAKMFNVSKATIRDVVLRKTWRYAV